jgi:hypothetical protein
VDDVENILYQSVGVLPLATSFDNAVGILADMFLSSVEIEVNPASE